MSGWNGALLGLNVKAREKDLAKEYLEFLGANVDGLSFDEEIGQLSYNFTPGVSGSLGVDSDDCLDVMQALEDHFGFYSNQFNGGRKKKDKSLIRLDELYHLTQRVFPVFRLYVAYEAGNSVSDEYYRYEAIYDSGTGKKNEVNCYYSYGDGINVDTDDPVEEGKEEKESAVADNELSDKDLKRLIALAREKGLKSIAGKLENPVKAAVPVDDENAAENEQLAYSFIIKNGELKHIEGEGSTLVIPEGVKSIGPYVFFENTHIETIVLPESLNNLGSTCFSGCKKLKSINLPDTIESIDNNPFMGCPALVEIKLSSDKTKYKVVDGVLFNKETGELICYPAGKKGTSYTVPDGTVRLGSFAFDSASELQSVSIPNSVVSMGDRPFLDCSHLLEIKVLVDHPVFCAEDGVLVDKNNKSVLFYPPEKPEREWSVPDGILKIDVGAFRGAANLKSINIPNSVSEIEAGAFEACSGLTSVTIPAGVKKLAGVFEGCSNLKEMTLLGDEIQYYPRGAEKNLVFKVHAGSDIDKSLSFQDCKVEYI